MCGAHAVVSATMFDARLIDSFRCWVPLVVSVLENSKQLRRSSHFKVVAQQRRSVGVVSGNNYGRGWWRDDGSEHGE